MSKGNKKQTLLDVVAHLKRDLAELSMQSPAIHNTNGPQQQQQQQQHMYGSRSESSLSTRSTAAGGGNVCEPHPVNGFKPKITLLNGIIVSIKDIRREALTVCHKAVAALRGTNADRMIGTLMEDHLLQVMDSSTSIVHRAKTLLRKEIQKLNYFMSMQREWEERQRRKRIEMNNMIAKVAGTADDASAPYSSGAVSKARFMIETPPNPWWRVVEHFYKWQHEEERTRTTNIDDVAAQRQPMDDPNYIEETELVGQAFNLLDDPNPKQLPSDAITAVDILRDLTDGAANYSSDKSAAVMILCNPELHAPEPVVTRVVTPAVRRKPGSKGRSSTLDADAAAAAAVVKTSLRIIVSEQYSRNLQQYFTKAVRDPQHPLGRSIKAFVSLQRSTILNAFSQMLVMLKKQERHEQQDGQQLPSSSFAANTNELEDDEDFGPLGHMNQQQALALFHVDRAEFVDAVCELCARRSFHDKGIPVYIANQKPATNSGSSSGGAPGSPGSPQLFRDTTSPQSTVGSSSLSRAGSIGDMTNGGNGFDYFDDNSSVASSRASGVAPYGGGMMTPRSSVGAVTPPRNGGRSPSTPGGGGGGTPSSPSKKKGLKYRLDITFPVMRLLPQLVAAQIELKLLEYYLQSSVAQLMDSQFSRKCQGFVQTQGQKIMLKQPISSGGGGGGVETASSVLSGGGGGGLQQQPHSHRDPYKMWGSERSDLGGGTPSPTHSSPQLHSTSGMAIAPQTTSLGSSCATPSQFGSFSKRPGTPAAAAPAPPTPPTPHSTPTTGGFGDPSNLPFVLLLEASAGILRDELTRLLATHSGVAQVDGPLSYSASPHREDSLNGSTHPHTNQAAAYQQQQLSHHYVYANDFYVEVIDALGNAYNAAEQAAIYQLKWKRQQKEKEKQQQLRLLQQQQAATRQKQQHQQRLCKEALIVNAATAEQQDDGRSGSPDAKPPGASTASRHVSNLSAIDASSCATGAGGGPPQAGPSSFFSADSNAAAAGAAQPLAVGADDVFPMVVLMVSMAGIDGPSIRALLHWMDTWAVVASFKSNDDELMFSSNGVGGDGAAGSSSSAGAQMLYSGQYGPADLAVLPTASILKSKGIEAFVRSTFSAAIEAVCAS